MRIKRPLNVAGVAQIMGSTSQMLTDRCPDLRTVFPTEPCTNRGCEFAIRQEGYLNCSFVAAEAGGPHTLDEIGDALGLTRERVRQIEAGALFKLRSAMEKLEDDATLHKPDVAPGDRRVDAHSERHQRQDKADLISAFNGRKLVQSGR
jgi:hypothetical protein